MNVQEIIIDLLAAMGPCTLADMVAEVLEQGDVSRATVLPYVIDAIASLQSDGYIAPVETEIRHVINDCAWDAV
jgi:hypothetical protein